MIRPGGLDVVTLWVSAVHDGGSGRDLWARLDDDLRLALAQMFIINTGLPRDDGWAAALAVRDSREPAFDDMMAQHVEHWREVYAILKHGSAFWAQPEPVGVGMELVVLCSPADAGTVEAGQSLYGHSFITRLSDDRGWVIAALARRLAVLLQYQAEMLTQQRERGD